MKKRNILLAAALVIVVATGSAAAQSAHRFAGTTCQSADVVPAYDLNYEGGGGVVNTHNTGAAWVQCPLAYFEGNTINMSTIEVWLKDNNNDTPQNSDDYFSCSPYLVTESSTTYTGTTMYTCGDWFGGCSYSTSNSWVGNGALTFAPTWGSISSVAGVSLFCKIPHSDGGVFSIIRRVTFNY